MKSHSDVNQTKLVVQCRSFMKLELFSVGLIGRLIVRVDRD